MPKKKTQTLIEYYNLLSTEPEYYEVNLQPEWLKFLAKSAIATVQKISSIALEKAEKGKVIYYLRFERTYDLSVAETTQKQDAIKNITPSLTRLLLELLAIEEEVIKDGQIVTQPKYTSDQATEMILQPKNWHLLSQEQVEKASQILSDSLIAENDHFWLVNIMMQRLCRDWTAEDTRSLNAGLFDAVYAFGVSEQQGIQPTEIEEGEEEKEPLSTQSITALAS